MLQSLHVCSSDIFFYFIFLLSSDKHHKKKVPVLFTSSHLLAFMNIQMIHSRGKNDREVTDM